MTKANFKKVATLWIVSWEFSVISRDSSILEQLHLKVAVHEFYPCVLRTMRLISFAYSVTQKIFEIILSALFA